MKPREVFRARVVPNPRTGLHLSSPRTAVLRVFEDHVEFEGRSVRFEDVAGIRLDEARLHLGIPGEELVLGVPSVVASTSLDPVSAAYLAALLQALKEGDPIRRRATLVHLEGVRRSKRALLVVPAALIVLASPAMFLVHPIAGLLCYLAAVAFLYRSNRSEWLLNEAFRAYLADEPERAVELLSPLAPTSGNWEEQFLLAVSLHKLGRAAEAARAADRVLLSKGDATCQEIARRISDQGHAAPARPHHYVFAHHALLDLAQGDSQEHVDWLLGRQGLDALRLFWDRVGAPWEGLPYQGLDLHVHVLDQGQRLALVRMPPALHPNEAGWAGLLFPAGAVSGRCFVLDRTEPPAWILREVLPGLERRVLGEVEDPDDERFLSALRGVLASESCAGRAAEVGEQAEQPLDSLTR